MTPKPKVPRGVLKGIKDLLNGRTASKEDLESAINSEERPEGCVCRADQYERFGHRDYCDEQETLSEPD